jgi:hypothetical protein
MRGPPRLRRRARLLIGENCIGKKQISLHSYEHESSSRDRSSCLRYQGVLTRAVLAGTLGYSQRCSGYSQGAAPRPLRSLCAAAVLAASGGLDGVLSAPAPTACVLISRDARSGYYDYCYGVLARTHSRGTHGGPTHAPLRKVSRAHGAVAAAVDVPKPKVERRRRKPAAATRGPMYQDRPTPA